MRAPPQPDPEYTALPCKSLPVLADAAPDPESAAIRAQEHARLRAAVDRLPPKLRAAVEARLDGRPVSAATFARAAAALREELARE